MATTSRRSTSRNLGRWALLGTGLQDLTLGPAPGKSRSVLLTAKRGCHAHFFITNGVAADR